MSGFTGTAMRRRALVSGDPQTVIDAGISVSGRTVAERDVPEHAFVDHIATWPEWDPDD